MTAAVWWYYTNQRRAMEAAAVRELAAVCDVEKSQIANWRRERIGDGRVLGSLAVMAIATRVLSSAVSREADRAELLDVLSRLAREFLYADAALVDLNGSVRIRLFEERTDAAELKRHLRGNLARQSVMANDVVLSDLSLDTRTGRPLIALTVPVHDLGAFILDIDPSRFLYPYLETWPGPSRTAETLLVRREENDIVYLSKRRNEQQTEVFIWF